MAPQTTKTSPWTMKVLRPILRRREEEDHQELEIRSLSGEEIKSLRKTDPFMYYSIPGVHRAATLLELVDDVEHSNKDALCRRGGQDHDRRKQLPVKRQKASVSRRTAISFEAHPSLILDDLLFDENEEDDSCPHLLAGDDVTFKIPMSTGSRCTARSTEDYPSLEDLLNDLEDF
jgi:hypothetical protein